jgi:hypothetical protein
MRFVAAVWMVPVGLVPAAALAGAFTAALAVRLLVVLGVPAAARPAPAFALAVPRRVPAGRLAAALLALVGLAVFLAVASAPRGVTILRDFAGPVVRASVAVRVAAAAGFFTAFCLALACPLAFVAAAPLRVLRAAAEVVARGALVPAREERPAGEAALPLSPADVRPVLLVLSSSRGVFAMVVTSLEPVHFPASD